MTRALVTGVTGQDGGYLAERLLADGVEVHALVLPGPPAAPVPDGVVTHRGDVGDITGTRRLLLEVAPRQVYNLAAISSVARSWSEPDEVIRVNGAAALGLLESAWQVQERTGESVAFVQASSAEIFGQPGIAPQDEGTAVAPINPYGAAKALAHHGCAVYRGRGLRASSLVLFNHESPRRPSGFVTRKITAAAAAIAAGRQDRLSLGNLAARRDWGWAPDYVDAMVRAARAGEADDYVIATGRSHSVREFTATAFAAAGVPDWEERVEIDPALLRPADATELVGDARRARDRLGWEPTVGFSDLVTRMVIAEKVP